MTLWLHGQQPPCSRIGSKWGYAPQICHALGLKGCELEDVWLVEADLALANAVAWLLRRPVDLANAVELAALGEPRNVWHRARDVARESFPDTVEAAAAWWLWVAGARGGIGGFKGQHKLRPNVDGFIPGRISLIERIRSSQPIPAQILTMDARDFDPPAGAIVYIDPPYHGAQGYGPELPRGDVQRLASEWHSLGCTVGVSEREPLILTGARHVELTDLRAGQFRRSLTRSRVEWLTILTGQSWA